MLGDSYSEYRSMKYALFKGVDQLTNAHPTRAAALIEGFERKVITSGWNNVPNHEPKKRRIKAEDDYGIWEVD